MDILFTITLTDAEEQTLVEQFPTCTFHFDGTIDSTAIETSEVIVTFGSDIDEQVLTRANHLKWIMVASAGIEKMDLEAIRRRDILVTNVRGIHKTPMAESVLAHLLALKRSIYEIHEVRKQKKWRAKYTSTELKGSTALILGPGAIGMEIGRLLQAFGVRTIGCNRSGKQVEFMDEIITFDRLAAKLPEADIIISVLPSTPDTRKLLKRLHFDAMKPSAIFMNFGRGDLFDESILIDVLKEEKIHHAVLDVFETEPLPETSPFWTLSNCTVSPHISSKSGMYIERALEIFAENLTRYLNQETSFVNTVDVLQGY